MLTVASVREFPVFQSGSGKRASHGVGQRAALPKGLIGELEQSALDALLGSGATRNISPSPTGDRQP